MNKNIFVIFIIFLIFVIFLVKVFSGQLILPQSFSLGPITIRYYGIIIAAAAAAAFYLAIKRSSLYGIDKNKAEDLLFWVIISGFIGARIYHIFTELGFYYQHPQDILKVWNGGLGIQGAVAGGIIGWLIYKQAKGLNYKTLLFLDWLTPSLILGQIIGRLGNLFNYELFGYPTNLPWKMFVPMQFRPEQYQQYNFFHPWFLYEALGNCLILAIIFFYGRRQVQPQTGGLFLWYVLLYNVLRFGLELLRVDSQFAGSIRLNNIVSFVLATLALSVLIYQKHAQKP